MPPWLFWAFLSAIFAASTAIFAKLGVEGINSDLAMFFRTIVVAVVLGLLLLATRQLQSIERISPKVWAFLVVSGLATGTSWFCYFRALKVGDAVRVAPIDKLSVVFVAVIGVALLGEHLSIQGWAGIILIAAGAILVAIS